MTTITELRAELRAAEAERDTKLREAVESCERMAEGDAGAFSESVEAMNECIEAGERAVAIRDELERRRESVRKPLATVQTHIRPNTLASNSLTDPALFCDGGKALDVSGKRDRAAGRNKVETRVSLEYESEDFTLSRTLRPFDRAVYDAVCSHWGAGNNCLTLQDVAEVVHGKSTRYGPALLDSIEDSLKVLEAVKCTVDYSQEARAHRLSVDGERVSSFKLEGRLLPLRKATITLTNGRTVRGYEIITTPTLYEYAERTRHKFLRYPQDLIDDTKGVMSATVKGIELRDLLLARVMQMRRGRLCNEFINYDNLFLQIAGDSLTKKERSKLADNVLAILEVLKGRKIVTGYTEKRDTGQGRKRLGVAVKVSRPEAKSKRATSGKASLH